MRTKKPQPERAEEAEAIPDAAKEGDYIDHPLLGRTQVISVYTRRQAIEDGILADCNQPPFGELNREVGMKWPMAMTATAFFRYVAVGEKMGGQDIKGRYWDVVWMLWNAIKRSPGNGTQLEFAFYCWPNFQGDATYWSNETRDRSCEGPVRRVRLKCVTGPGDTLEPCMTIMLPEED